MFLEFLWQFEECLLISDDFNTVYAYQAYKFFEREDFAILQAKRKGLFLPVPIFGTPENFSIGNFHGFFSKKTKGTN